MCKLLRIWNLYEVNFFWGGAKDKQKIHWITWDQVLADKKQEGLDIGSLVSFNFSLLQK